MVTTIDVRSLLEHIEAGGEPPKGIELPQEMSKSQREAWDRIVEILDDRRNQD
ncbi:hypothetical protein N9J72_00425 [Candidatus Gracilibacteria bacterium]|nr:hypothetical protein [Candidatus Gracilibacteria bacterium]